MPKASDWRRGIEAGDAQITAEVGFVQGSEGNVDIGAIHRDSPEQPNRDVKAVRLNARRVVNPASNGLG